MGQGFWVRCALATVALVLSTLVGPTDARAQYASFPCAYGINGAGPGEIVIGMGDGGFLMCTYSGEAQSQQQQQQEEYQRPPPPPPTPKTYTDAFYSVVVHPDAVKVWASARRFTLEGTQKDSLAYCTKMMGSGCRIAVSGSNNTVYVYKLPDGSLIIPGDGAWSVERGKILKNCEQRIRCAQADRITSPIIATEVGAPINDVSYYVIPKDDAELHNRFGTIAWTGAGKKIWTSGGHKTRADAESAAIALCQKSQGSAPVACKTAIGAGNALMIVWTDKKKNIFFESDFPPADIENITPKLTWEHFNNICKTKKPKCTLKQVIDARQSGEFEKTVL
jgi:hypothetical protein